VNPHSDAIDPQELARAWSLIRSAAEHLGRVAREESLPGPFSPLRYLILATLGEATSYGLSARRLARSLCVRPSTLARWRCVSRTQGVMRSAGWARPPAPRPSRARRA